MRTLNLGVVAHVDAGKTSLTERLLYAAGVIDAVGSVDRGDTQTDTLALERERGITIKSAVASFLIGDVTVNLIDTPGHPDFVAEVDRVLSLLDGVVLVVSAVEGVQSQTRVLMRALQRLGVPALLFVNKIDRAGADVSRVVAAMADKLSPAVVAMERVQGLGGTGASVAQCVRGDAAFLDEVLGVLAEFDDDVLASYSGAERGGDEEWLLERLEVWTKRAMVHPVYFGSAITGAGISELIEGITRWLPIIDRGADGPGSGVVFKIERAPTGERAAIVRLFSGTVRVRDRLLVRGVLRRVTRIAVFEPGGVFTRQDVRGGQIARLSGLGAVRIGDTFGEATVGVEQHFAPPPFEAVVVPADEDDRQSLYTALGVLSEEDPLIDLRQHDERNEMSVSLYGQVQEEVIRETLWRDFGIAVSFGVPLTVCIERLAGRGEAVEMMLEGRTSQTPFLAGVGLRVEPTTPGTGVAFSPGIELGRLPSAFVNAVEEAVHDTLRHGLFGWDIPDCSVTMTASRYAPRQSHAHATFDKSMSSIANDFRLLTPLVLMEAIRHAGTIVYEPVHRFYLEAPAAALGAVTRLLGSVDADLEPPQPARSSIALRGLIAAARLKDLRQQLPGLTQGEGFVEARFHSHRRIRGSVRKRIRIGRDPLDRTAYLRAVAGHD